MRVVSGHQPVYLPWLGLIHKAYLADVFVFMDDVQYLSQDWNNRNRIKSPQGTAVWMTVPVDLKNSISKCLKDIAIKDQKGKFWQDKHFRTLQSCYGKAPFFKNYLPFFQWYFLEERWEGLVELNLAMLRQLFEWFDIRAEIVVASELDFSEKNSGLVLEHGLRFHADVVVTGCHGREYIDEQAFNDQGIQVIFQDYQHPSYGQRFGEFVSHLSFVDLLFNHGPGSLEICLEGNIREIQ